MTDLTTDAGIAAVQARLRGESDRLTDADLDAIEFDRLRKLRLGKSIARETDLDMLAIDKLLAEARRLRAELAEERLRVRALQAADADHARDRDTIERILAALDGEQ